MTAPHGFVHWEEVHGYLQRPNQPGTRLDPLPSAAPHPPNAPRRTQ
jgi:hypothetical protein